MKLLCSRLLMVLIVAAWLPIPVNAFETSALTISCDGAAPVSFQVELAQSPDERRQGLMYRTQLPQRTGMLFDFGQDQSVTMWMRNTYVALDMLFLRADGMIVHIHRDAVPLDETYISPGIPVRGVFEVPAGTSHIEGLRAGCILHHPLFTPSD